MVTKFLQHDFPNLQIATLNLNFNASVRQGLTWVIGNLGLLFSGLAQIFFIVFLTLFGLFYFLKDGDRLKAWLLKFVPLSGKYTEGIIHETEGVITSVVRGSLMVAVIQGIVVGLGLLIFGMPDAAFLGLLTVLLTLIPIVGTWLIVIPAIAYFFLTGHTGASIGFAIWSVVLVNIVFNVVSPQFMKRGTNIHPFIILLSVLGGLALFGPIGFLIGPFIIAFLFSLLNIYPKIILKKSSRSRPRENDK